MKWRLDRISRFLALAVLAITARSDPILPPGYSSTEPAFDHEKIAIALDAAGRAEESHQSFKAFAHFTDGVTALDNLGVSHMRRNEWLLAAKSFARAVRRHSMTSNLESNLKDFRQILSQPHVPHNIRQECLRELDEASAAAVRWPTPTAIHAGGRLLRDDEHFPPHRALANRSTFWRFIRSATFREGYWERRPLHMTVGKGSDDCFASVLTLQELMAPAYTFRMDKGNHQEYNVNLVRGSFLQMQTLGWQVAVPAA